MHPSEIEIADYTYELPSAFIAEQSLAQRDASKLLQYKDGEITHHIFTDLPNLLPANSAIVFNNSKVIPARIHFTTAANAIIEIFCLEPMFTKDYVLAMAETKKSYWKCLVGNKKKWKEEKLIKQLSENVTVSVQIIAASDDAYEIAFEWNSADTFAEILLTIGNIPLPPYIKRKVESKDSQTYQTVYAKHNGSVAAPTAGLHFTQSILEKLQAKNVQPKYITLHVGAGTFKPVKSAKMANHVMHAESFVVTKDTLKNILNIENVFCVGTTTLRTLESIYWLGVKLILNKNTITNKLNFHISQWEVYEPQLQNTNYSVQESLQAFIHYLENHNTESIICNTQIIITNLYKIKTVKALITNFHQPQSTLLLLISSIVQHNWKNIYTQALQNNYRFLSYGDSSILWL